METKTQSLFFLGTYVKPQQQTTLPSRTWKRIEEQKTSTKNATSKPIPEEPISNDPFHEALEKLPTFDGERKLLRLLLLSIAKNKSSSSHAGSPEKETAATAEKK